MRRLLILLLLVLAAGPALAQSEMNMPGSRGFHPHTGYFPSLRDITSGAADSIRTSDFQSGVSWRSGVASNKSEVFPVCGPVWNGKWVMVADGNGTAATYPITVTAAAGSVYGSSFGYQITSNYGSAIFQCDGANANWVVQGRFAPGTNVRVVAGTSDTIVAADKGGVVEYTSASPVAVTLPGGTSVAGFVPSSFAFQVFVNGTGTVTVTPNNSATISYGTTSGGSSLALVGGQSAYLVMNSAGNWQTLLGSTVLTLGAGLTNSLSTYNPGTQTVTNGGLISPQLTNVTVSASCTLDSTCATANDSGHLVTPTSSGVAFTLPSPAATHGEQVGYDGSHTWNITTPSGVIYGYGTSAVTQVGIGCQAQFLPDGVNWQMIASAGCNNSSTPGYVRAAVTAGIINSVGAL